MICWPEGDMEFVSRAGAEGSSGDGRWPCKVRVKSHSRYMAELIIHYGRGSCINAVLGKYMGGQYVCIPDMDVGCAVGRFSDIEGNKEKLRFHMGDEEAATVAHALRAISGYSGTDWI